MEGGRREDVLTTQSLVPSSSNSRRIGAIGQRASVRALHPGDISPSTTVSNGARRFSSRLTIRGL